MCIPIILGFNNIVGRLRVIGQTEYNITSAVDRFNKLYKFLCLHTYERLAAVFCESRGLAPSSLLFLKLDYLRLL